jgi:predicted nucleotidyltransferase
METTTPADSLAPSARVKALVNQVSKKIHHELGNEVKVIWFGSWVRGDAQPYSDIDLAISSPQPIDFGDFSRLFDWIDDLPTLFSIDLVNSDEASPELKNQIERHGIIID